MVQQHARSSTTVTDPGLLCIVFGKGGLGEWDRLRAVVVDPGRHDE